MIILGYITYAVLVFLAITFALGVRFKLGVSVATIFGSLIFTISVIIIPIFKISFFHALWIIPLGFLLPLTLAFLFSYKVISIPLVFISSIYAGVLRLGIDRNKIQQAQQKSALEAVENWSKKQE